MNGPPPSKNVACEAANESLDIGLADSIGSKRQENWKALRFRDSCRMALSKAKTAKAMGKMVNEPKPFANHTLEIL